MEYKSYEIKNTNHINALSGRLDVAEERPIYYGENKLFTEKYKGIYNASKQDLAQVASDRYAIIQHNDVAKVLFDTLQSKNIDVHGRVDDFGNQVRFDLVFGNQGVPIKDDSSGIQLGMRVVNSFNKTTAFRLEMFGFRLVCQNGMSLGKAMHQVKEVCFHTGQKDLKMIRGITERFIADVINNSSRLQIYVDECMKDSLHWKNTAKLLEALLKSKKHREKICELLSISIIEIHNEKTNKKMYDYVLDKDAKENISRWEIYNALTQYATHTDLGIVIEQGIQESAQKILSTKSEKLVEQYVPQTSI